MTRTAKGKRTNQADRRNHTANRQATAAGLPTVEDVARYLMAVEDLLAWAPARMGACQTPARRRLQDVPPRKHRHRRDESRSCPP